MEKRYPPEEFSGARIKLKRFNIALAEQMYAYVDRDRNRLEKFLPWPPAIQSVADEIKFIEDSRKKWDDFDTFGFAIFRSNDNEYLGNVSAFGLDWKNELCEIGYWIFGDFEGKGFMIEAVALLEKVLFELGFNRLVIRCEPDNQRSALIPRRLSYFYEGISRQIKLDNGKYRDLEVYSKLRSDISKHPNTQGFAR